MRVKVTEQGLVIPKELLEGIQEVEIRREDLKIVVIPIIKLDPILGLGSNPINPSVTDASENHDAYLSGSLLDYAGILEDSPNFNEDPVEIQRKMRDEWS
jgi:virulence-associated protein VagC